jgi:hypothetical protein
MSLSQKLDKHGVLEIVTACAIAGSALVQDAAVAQSDLEGMWSDPPATALDTFCYFSCTDAGLDYLGALLDDPANDDRAYPELRAEAERYQREQYFGPRLTAAGGEAARAYDPADDPGFLYCEPWGFAREIFAPHQLEIRQFGDRVEMRYGEWDIRRTVYLDGRERPETEPPSPMGFSTGRYEGDTLVIATSGITANIAAWGRHSDQLLAVERYTRSDDGKLLLLSATMEDPWSLREPVVLKKVWSFAPNQEIFPYEDCERPTEFSRGVNRR